MGKHRKIEPGAIFENLQVVQNLGLREFYGKNTGFYKCKCLKCGNIIDVPGKYLGTFKKDCGCGKSEPRKEVPIGKKYGHLTIVGLGHYKKGRGYWYVCECDCEKHTRLEVRRDMLLCGDVSSCGCVHDNLLRENAKIAYEKNFVQSTNVPVISNKKLYKNNTSGVKGVNWHKNIEKWQASIQFQGTKYCLGYYNDIKKAKEIRETAEKELQKDFWKWYEENFPKEYRKIKERANKEMH